MVILATKREAVSEAIDSELTRSRSSKRMPGRYSNDAYALKEEVYFKEWRQTDE